MKNSITCQNIFLIRYQSPIESRIGRISLWISFCWTITFKMVAWGLRYMCISPHTCCNDKQQYSCFSFLLKDSVFEHHTAWRMHDTGPKFVLHGYSCLPPWPWAGGYVCFFAQSKISWFYNDHASFYNHRKKKKFKMNFKHTPKPPKHFFKRQKCCKSEKWL